MNTYKVTVTHQEGDVMVVWIKAVKVDVKLLVTKALLTLDLSLRDIKSATIGV